MTTTWAFQTSTVHRLQATRTYFHATKEEIPCTVSAMDTIRDLILHWEAAHGSRHVAARRQYNMMLAALVGGSRWRIPRATDRFLRYGDPFTDGDTRMLWKGDVFYHFTPVFPNGRKVRLTNIQFCTDMDCKNVAPGPFLHRQNQFVHPAKDPKTENEGPPMSPAAHEIGREKSQGVTCVLQISTPGRRKPWWQGGRWQERPQDLGKYTSMHADKDIQNRPFTREALSARQWLLVQALGLYQKIIDSNELTKTLFDNANAKDNSVWDQLMLAHTGAYMDDIVRAAMKEHGHRTTTEDEVRHARDEPGHDWIKKTYYNMVRAYARTWTDKGPVGGGRMGGTKRARRGPRVPWPGCRPE